MATRRVSPGSRAAAGLVSSLVILLLAGLSPARAENPSMQKSLVKVLATSNPPDPWAPWRRTGPDGVSGSGVIIGGKRVLTAAHLVADAVMLEVQRSFLGKRYTANVEYVCHSCDLALLSVADPRFFEGSKPLEIGSLPRLQDRIEVHGFPTGGEGLSVTSGIVSRVGVDQYAHSFQNHLIVQVDAAINPGNSGGPAIADGRVMGIAIQSAVGDVENLGYVVPPTVIRHFLKDVEDGRFDGFPELGVAVQTLANPALREATGLANVDGGVLITAVSPVGSAHGKLRPGDVLLEIAGTPVGEDGRVDFDNGLRVLSMALVQSVQVGDSLDLIFQRDGVRHTTSVVMREPAPLVPLGEYDRDIPYRIYGGFVFQQLTARFLVNYGTAPGHLEAYLRDPTKDGSTGLVPSHGVEGRREVVVISRVLHSELTRGYEEFEEQVIYSVNDTLIRDLHHLSQLLDASRSRFVTIKTEQGNVASFQRDQVDAANRAILERFRIVSDRSQDLMQAPAAYSGAWN